DQAPPAYSARKVQGKKLYEYARKGKPVPEVDARKIRVDDFEVLNLEDGLSEFGVDCTSGTYVRSLVHELGQKLGCGAILTELRRTDVGFFGIEDSKQIPYLESLKTKAQLRECLLPLSRAMPDIPTMYLGPG